MTSEPPSRRVVVLDVGGRGDRRLLETIQGAGFEGVEAESLDDVVPKLEASRALVAAFAFEALWPSPQPTLRALREWTPGTRFVVVHSDGGPRLRLGRRLWAAGLLDYFLPRSTPPYAMTPVLRQAYADALIEAGTRDVQRSLPDLNPLASRIRLLQNLSAAFASQRRLDGIFRELQIRLPHLIDYHVLEVLVVDLGSARLFILPNRPVEHSSIWHLAEETCAAVAPFVETPPRPEDLIVFDNPVLPVEEDTDDEPTMASQPTSIVLPMVLGGELVGCLSLLTRSPQSVASDQRAILRLISYQLSASIRNAQALESAETESLVDALTGAHNRRYLSRVLGSEWRRAKRYGLHLGVAMLDIDHFKKINDVHGHVTGDAVLRALASLIRGQLRDTDHLIRYGGEEFLLVLPETGAGETALVLERLRLLLARQPLVLNEQGLELHAGFSAGVAAYPAAGTIAPEELVDLADKALLVAKRSGRDRVCVYSEQGFEDVSDLELDGAQEKRRFPRLSSQLRVRYMQLPEIETRLVTMESTDVSSGGIAVRGPELHLRKSSYALVQLEDGGRPVLSRVVWTKEEGSGTRSAGLQFIRPEEVAELEARKSMPPLVVPRALVLSESTRTRDLVSRVLRAARYDAKLLYETLGGLDTERLEDYSLIVIGESSLRRDLGGLLQRIRDRAGPAVRLVVINESSDRSGAIETIRSEQVEHLIGGDEASDEALFATLNKLLLGEYFGMEKYLLWGADPKSWTIGSPSEKEHVLAGIKLLAKEVRCHPRIADLLVASVDEMVINALYRPTSMANVEPTPITVECGSDGRLLAVSVRDDHGLFQYEHLLRGLGEALQHEREGIPEGASQASLGFRIMLGALSQLAINVEPGRRTELIGIVDLRKSLRQHRETVPSLGIFRKDE